jgi:hypothetical protein
MSASEWRPLRRIDFARLGEARAHAHQAAQWLARAAYAYLPNQPDHSHSSVAWDDTLDGFCARPLKEELRVALRVSDLTISLLEGDGGKHSKALVLNGRRDIDVGAWLAEQLSAKGFDARALDEVKLPYAIALHPLASGATYDATGLADALEDLAAWFANANGSLDRIRERVGRKYPASEVRCWPHHFDIATLIVVAGGAESGRSIGVGLSPGDTSYAEPYFYVTPWPYPSASQLGFLPALGHWHTEGYTAAVATAESILNAKNPQAATEAFLEAAIQVSIKALS